MATRRPLVAGNWKMNGLAGSLSEIEAILARLGDGAFAPRADAMLCPPATLLAELSRVAVGSRLQTGGQDCHAEPAGAHTGDLSAAMLKDAGAVAVIVGHSERRANHGELDREVAAKAGAAHRAGLAAIICVGETAGERSAGLTLEVVGRQLAGSLPPGAGPKGAGPKGAGAGNTIIAYEPVWAIGTGRTPTAGDVAEVHGQIRRVLSGLVGAEAAQAIRILYGGSVKPSNARELMAVADVDGALVGGASLKAADFLGILAAYS